MSASMARTRVAPSPWPAPVMGHIVYDGCGGGVRSVDDGEGLPAGRVRDGDVGALREHLGIERWLLRGG